MVDSAERAANSRDSGGQRIDKAAAKFVERLEGNYKRQMEWTLERWLKWLRQETAVRTFDGLEPIHCRRWATSLRADDELGDSSVRAYYSRVRAFLTWCVGEEWLATNPAATNQATEELPDSSEKPKRQYWKGEARKQLLNYVDKRAHDSLDADDYERQKVFRDRALVAMLAVSGVRGAEIANVPGDDRRNGITWNDIDFEGGTISVLGKGREQEDAPLPQAITPAIERYKQVLDPPNDDWPVFPTRHRQTLKSALEEQAPEAVDTDGLIRERIRACGVTPPAITVEGVRTVMERLSDEAGVDIDGEYLKPHGARRGIGDLLYREQAEKAQAALRHKSIETTHESYADIKAGEVAEDIDRVLGQK